MKHVTVFSSSFFISPLGGLQLIHVTRERKPEHVIRVFKWTSYFQWCNRDHRRNVEDLIEICKNGFFLCWSKGLWRDKSLFYRETVLFSGFVSRQWFKNVLDIEVGEIYMSIILLMRDSCFIQTRTNLGAERLCKNGSSKGSGRKPRYMYVPCQAITDNSFFLVARLIKDKANALSTVNQSVIWELFVWSWNSIQKIIM